MSSSQKTVDFITKQMSRASNVRKCKMFGEYAIYCDDQLFVKITEPGKALLKNEELAPAYTGAKKIA